MPIAAGRLKPRDRNFALLLCACSFAFSLFGIAILIDTAKRAVVWANAQHARYVCDGALSGRGQVGHIFSAWRNIGSRPDQIRCSRTRNIFRTRLSTFGKHIMSFLLGCLAVKTTPSLCVLHPSYAVENRSVITECLAKW
jgi:hypothetical protein